jgi:hypothetical protein
MNLDRILAAAGVVPAELDREQLLSDLAGIASLYRTSVDLRNAPAKRRQRVSRIIAAAEGLKSLIDDDWYLRGRHRPALDRLIADAARTTKVLDAIRMSALDNLIYAQDDVRAALQ